MARRAIYEDDRLYLLLRNENYHLFGTLDGKRVRKACGTRDLTKAKLFLETYKREHENGWRDGYEHGDREWKEVAKFINDRQKHNAVKRGMPFELNPGIVYSLMKSTGFRCAVSGIAFSSRFAEYGKRDPWSPSIDRIENRQGYLPENVRVVCLAANLAMNDWGFDTLLRLSRGIHRSSLTLADELPSDRHNDGEEDTKALMKLVENE